MYEFCTVLANSRIIICVSRLLTVGIAGLAAVAILVVVIVTTCSVVVIRWKRKSTALNYLDQTPGMVR